MFFFFSRSLERSLANSIRFYSRSIIKKSKIGEHVGYEPYQMEVLQKEFLSRPGAGNFILETKGNIATLTINNPTKKNAIRYHFFNTRCRIARMVAELSNHLTTLESFDGNVLILKGANHTFCSGADLSTAKQYLNDKVSKIGMCAMMQDNLMRIRHLPLITLCLIEGYAIGGGAEITTSCDYRIMTSEAMIQFIHCKLGLIPGWGGAGRLVHILGKDKALKLIGSSMKIHPAVAKELEYVEMISNRDDLDKDVNDFVDPFVKNPSASIQGVKQMIINAEDNPLDAQLLKRDRDIFSKLWGSKDNLNAFDKNKHVNK